MIGKSGKVSGIIDFSTSEGGVIHGYWDDYAIQKDQLWSATAITKSRN